LPPSSSRVTDSGRASSTARTECLPYTVSTASTVPRAGRLARRASHADESARRA
jgi:hypothetical protein